MTRKLIHTAVSITGTETFKVYRDSEWQEFVVRTYRNGVLYEPADSFIAWHGTYDAKQAKADAIAEAEFYANGLFFQRLARFFSELKELMMNVDSALRATGLNPGWYNYVWKVEPTNKADVYLVESFGRHFIVSFRLYHKGFLSAKVIA